MGISSSRGFFCRIRKEPESFYIIHYSCQSLNDDNEGLSARITSIGVTHFSTEQTVSFSTHAMAEEMGIARDHVQCRFDEVEWKLIKEFYEFIKERRNMFWVHWNMRNVTYGFEHLEHRYRVLKAKIAPDASDASVIPVERRVNLNDMLEEKYGAGYVGHPRMKNLMEINGGVHRHLDTSGNAT